MAPVGARRRYDVLGACVDVVAAAESVHVDSGAVARLAATLAAVPTPPAAWDPPHLGRGDAAPERVAGWVLLLSSMNFSFWEPEPRWRIDGRDGYLALATALRRAHDAGVPVGDARHDAAMSTGELAAVLAGDRGGPPLPPLFAERHAIATSTAAWIAAEWDADPLGPARAATDAYGFAETLAARLPRFRDVAEWRGRRVPFLKRAQIAAFDLGVALGGGIAALQDRRRLTAFADYKVPQLLRAEGVLVLAPELAARVDGLETLAAGEAAEVEIRAATVVAVDRLARSLRDSGAADDAASVDSRLWWRAQGRAGMPPYHRVRTVWY